MATQSLTITETPVDIVAALGLQAGKPYMLQLPRGVPAEYSESDAATVSMPDARHLFFVGPLYEFEPPAAGGKIWVRSVVGENRIIITEAAD